MKLFFFFIFLGFPVTFFAQQIDYNTQKGAVANGYDVVSYFSDTPIKGKKEFLLKYDGVYFFFSSKENLNTFKKKPEKYVPQYGGYCAYAIAEKNKKMDVDPEVYEIRDGKLYLFFSPWFGSKLNDWQKGNVKERQEKGNKNWTILKHKK